MNESPSGLGAQGGKPTGLKERSKSMTIRDGMGKSVEANLRRDNIPGTRKGGELNETDLSGESERKKQEGEIRKINMPHKETLSGQKQREKRGRLPAPKMQALRGR